MNRRRFILSITWAVCALGLRLPLATPNSGWPDCEDGGAWGSTHYLIGPRAGRVWYREEPHAIVVCLCGKCWIVIGDEG